MSNPFLTNEVQLLFAKTLHDMAAPLGALTLCIDDIKTALPSSADLIETSIETLSHKISYWRLMMTGSNSSPTYSDAANAMRAMAKLKSVEIVFSNAQDYQGIYVRLLLALVLLALESLPRGGRITVDADGGSINASGEKCYLSKELQEAIEGQVKVPSSRHALGLLICDWAKACEAQVTLEHDIAKLVLALQKQ